MSGKLQVGEGEVCITTTDGRLLRFEGRMASIVDALADFHEDIDSVDIGSFTIDVHGSKPVIAKVQRQRRYMVREESRPRKRT